MTDSAGWVGPRRAAPRAPPRGWVRLAIRRRGNIAAFCVLLAVACVMLLPFYWMFSSSLRTMENMFSLPHPVDSPTR